MSDSAPKTPNEVARQLIGRDWLSYSAVSAFQRCPLQFYFRYVAALPEETVSASLVFGGAIHRSIEYHFRQLQAGQPPPGIEMLRAEYEAAWQERVPDEIRFGRDEDAGSLGQVADRVLAAFHISDVARPDGRVVGVEQELRGQLAEGCPDLLARVDLLVETESELVVTDIKTSRSRWSAGQAHESAEQLLLYSELAGPLAPGKQVRLEFAVLTKTKTPAVDRLPVEFSPRRVERTKRIFERVWQAIQSGHFYPAPSPLSCGSCPFRGPCGGWAG